MNPASTFSFGAPAASSGAGFSFGAPTTSAPAFGTATGTTFGFGATGAPASSATGFSVGGFNAATSQPSFGTGFGQQQANFSFGQQQQQPPATGSLGSGLFGTQPTSSASNAFGFGTAASTAPAFGPNFGTTPQFGFGTTTNSSFQLGGFGSAAAPTSAVGGLFGAATAPTQATGTLFGLQQPSAGTGLQFGTQPAAFPQGQGSSLLPVASGGSQQQQQLQQLLLAVSQPSIFNDERDALIAKWNALQALWGAGRGYYNQQGQYVDFARSNPFCAFKAIGYSCIPKFRTEDGMVSFIFTKKLADFEPQQGALVDALNKLINRPNMNICVESVKAISPEKTEMVFYVQERTQSGTTKRTSASESFNFFCQPQMRLQLQTQFSVENILPRIGFTAEQLSDYLNNPPPGVDIRIWNQAKLDNPDPDKFIPVPIVGFEELHKRLKNQEQQTQLHQLRLGMISDELDTLKKSLVASVAKIEEYKRRHLELSHRVLKVIVKQEIYRKLGYAFQPEEEQLRIHLENLQAELNAPTQFKGRLNEIMSQLRLQQHDIGLYDTSCQLDQNSTMIVRQHLKSQQEGIQQLINVIKEDLMDLTIIDQGWQEAAIQHKR